jgi:hypothetical protein
VPLALASRVVVKVWIVVSLFFIAAAALAVFPLGRKLLVTYSRSSFLTLSALFPVGLLIASPAAAFFFLPSKRSWQGMLMFRNIKTPQQRLSDYI